MDIPTPVSTSFGILRFIKFGLLGLFIGLILLEAIYASIHSNSINPFITTIGNKLVYSTNELSLASKEIVQQDGYYVRTPDFWTGILKFLKINITFFLSFYALYMWIYVFSWIIARTPFSDKDKTFNNYFFAIIIFFLIQGIFILGMAGVNKNIECFGNCEKSAISYFISPATSFKDFFIALDFILQPAFGIANKVNNIPLANGT